MSENLGNVIVDEQNINLSTSSIEKLKETLEKLNNDEKIIKQEIDEILKSLV